MTSAPGLRTDRRRIAAWLAPVAVLAVVAAAVVAVNASSSSATPTLPPKTAAQLIEAVQAASATAAYSGEVAEDVHLGLPALPDSTSSNRQPASLSIQSLLTGSHTARVWVDGPTRQRVAILGQLSEADVTHNGADVWTYTSDTNTVTHATLPQPNDPSAAGPALSPAALTAQLLRAIGPTTAVGVGAPRTVAGRAAYVLVVQPRDSRSTINAVTFAIDAEHNVPLQVQVQAGGSSPAFSVSFTSVSFTRPAASTFAFTVPKGATVETPGSHRHHHDGPPRPGGADGGQAPALAPTVIGSGWVTAVEIGGIQVLPDELMSKFTTPVAGSSDRILHTALINVIVTPDGRTYVGALEPAALEQLAASRR